MKRMEALIELRDKWEGCDRCRLHKHRKNIVFGRGNVPADLVIVGEAPGADEDASGKPFVGRSGKDVLRPALEKAEADMSRVFITNLCACRPPENRDPLFDELEACSPRLKATIVIARPRVILVLGRVGAISLLGERSPMKTARGKWYETKWGKDDKLVVPTMVTYHPSFILRDGTYRSLFEQDVQTAWERASNAPRSQ